MHPLLLPSFQGHSFVVITQAVAREVWWSGSPAPTGWPPSLTLPFTPLDIFSGRETFRCTSSRISGDVQSIPHIQSPTDKNIILGTNVYSWWRSRSTPRCGAAVSWAPFLRPAARPRPSPHFRGCQAGHPWPWLAAGPGPARALRGRCAVTRRGVARRGGDRRERELIFQDGGGAEGGVGRDCGGPECCDRRLVGGAGGAAAVSLALATPWVEALTATSGLI